MPRIGMEPLRRRALIDAAIDAIGERGSLEVTMAEIAGRAGVSPALAHHYFGAKEDLLLATMRHILAELGRDLGEAVTGLEGLARVRAIIAVNFSQKQFRPEIIAAWLAFYVAAQRTPALRRLLRVYARRLHSNLVFALRPLLERDEAERTAEGIAAMIDGLYIRRALKDGPPDAASAIALVEDYVALRTGGLRHG
ncbi:transcriptional regulator BetI [Chelativorans intermedius]|uniref:HTH-type transcriptional regulator BetI n=1 Tax=Chelativorans intermedius TaxID=515947 RepID=A0ABV6D8Z1_9HYPH|nr:transcriptional regulator BetI [Chelativorans intermedius]MCT8998732.1 transcriptional regulator BetI [Chelativorans intermedius]